MNTTARPQYHAHLVFLLLLAGPAIADERVPSYDVSEYYDSRTLVENNVSEISNSIYLDDKDTLKEDDLYSCITVTSTFDKQGRELTSDLNRMGSYIKNVYKDGKIVDAEYIDKISGEVESRYSEMIEDPVQLKKTLKISMREL